MKKDKEQRSLFANNRLNSEDNQYLSNDTKGVFGVGTNSKKMAYIGMMPQLSIIHLKGVIRIEEKEKEKKKIFDNDDGNDLTSLWTLLLRMLLRGLDP